MTDEKPFRDRLQTDFDERYPKLLEVIDKGLSATTTAWVNCPHCKKRSEVEVVDTKAALLAAEFIANQSHGRPGVAADAGDEEAIKLVRVIQYDGVGADQFELLQTKLQTIVDNAEELPEDVREALDEYLEHLSDVAEAHLAA
jgi:N-acetylglucosamine-6-phosphate deacetylase